MTKIVQGNNYRNVSYSSCFIKKGKKKIVLSPIDKIFIAYAMHHALLLDKFATVFVDKL